MMIPFWRRPLPPQDYYLRSRDGSYLFHLPDGICKIGRANEMRDYFSESPYVAQCQAIFEKTEDGDLYIQQTGLNTITVNGKRIGRKSSRTLLRENDSLVIVGHQFDVIGVSREAGADLKAPSSQNPDRDTVSEYEGFYTYATGVDRFVLRGPQGKEYSVTREALPQRAPRIRTESADWYFGFPGGDEPTIVPGLRGYIYDTEGKEVASVEYRKVLEEPEEYVLRSPDGEVRINSYPDGSFDFFLQDEKIAHFRRSYEPARRYSAFGDVFPKDYYAWCVSRLSEVTRTLILSIPFIGHFGVSANYRTEELRCL